MDTVVVDTNVAIAANRDSNTHVDEACQLACVEKLENLTRKGIIAIDDQGLILEEYSRKLTSSRGAKSAGNMFFIHVFRNHYNTDLIRRFPVSPIQDENIGFKELPKNNFDHADRKFLAVAVVAKAKVLNAADSDWAEHEKLMAELGVDVEELCPQHIKQKSRRGKR